MIRPRIGQLSARVKLRLWKDEPAAGGGIEPGYADVATLWAKIEPVGAGIYHSGMQVGKTVTHRIFIRVRPDVTSDHVIEHAGRRFRVQRITDLDGRFTVIEAEEEGPAT